MQVVEITARIGDSVVDVAHVPAGGSYRAHDGSLLVVGGHPVVSTVTIGLVMFTVARGERENQPVPRPRIAKQPFAYLAASLVVQLAILLVALATAPFERLTRPVHRIVRLTHVHATLPPEPPKPAPEPTKPAPADHAVATAAAERRTARTDEARAGKASRPVPDEIDRLAGNPGAQLAHFEKLFDDLDVKGQLAKTDGPLVDASTVDPGGFGGGGHHFNADAVAPEQTYAVGRWALPTWFHGKGQLAPVPTIEWCDDDSCLTRGALPLEGVLAILSRHEKQIAQCYREHTGDLAGNVRVRFPIGADGKVTGKLGTETGPVGYGTGTVGRCIARIAQGIRWPQAADATYVFVGLAFRPASG